MISLRHLFPRLFLPVFLFSIIFVAPLKSYATTVVCPVGIDCPLPSVSITARVPGITSASSGSGGGGVINLLEFLAALEVLQEKVVSKADYNNDKMVDIIDLSILLFYYNKTGPQIAPYDLNGDGHIGIEDISIMFYYWTIFK